MEGMGVRGQNKSRRSVGEVDGDGVGMPGSSDNGEK